jgi:V8-like Glu-specific endopeptidase
MSGESGEPFVCTAFLVARDKIATAGHCMAKMKSAEFLLFRQGVAVKLNVALANKEEFKVDEYGGYAYLKLQEPVDERIQPLVLAEKAPQENAGLGVIYSRGGQPLQTVWGAEDCRVIKLDSNLLYHRCDTGGGTTGAPIFDIATNAVVGIHYRRDKLGGAAYRLDGTQ